MTTRASVSVQSHLSTAEQADHIWFQYIEYLS